MLSTARVDLPTPIAARLQKSSEFVDNIMEFAREDLIGFRRPLAATFAYSAPFVLAVVYQSAGLVALAQAAAGYFFVAGLGLYLVGRQLWPGLVEEYQERSAAKSKAIADLKCGFGEAAFLNLRAAPYFVEYDYGVLAFADAGDFKTLFFSISASDDDPRWSLYCEGELDRRVWRWLRLPVSREIVKFSTEGSKHNRAGDAPRVDSIDAWEAIHTSLGEPLDGAVIHRPLDEVVDTVRRLL